MAEGRISITIDADDKFSAVINRADKSLKMFNLTAKKSQGAFSQMGASIIVMNQGLQLLQQTILPVARGFNTLLKTADKFRRMQIALVNLTGDAEFAVKVFDDLVKIARKSPQSLESLTDSFVRLKATGIKDTQRVLRGIIDAVSAFGGSSVDIKLVALAFQQMAGKGVVSMEELRRQLGERVPTAIKILARELGLTLPELFKKVETGSLDSMVAIEALTRGFEKDFSGSAERMLKTWQGATAKMVSEWELLAKAVGDTGLLDKSIETVNSLTSAIRKLSDGLVKINKAKELEIDDQSLRSTLVLLSQFPFLGFIKSLEILGDASEKALKATVSGVEDLGVSVVEFTIIEEKLKKTTEEFNKLFESILNPKKIKDSDKWLKELTKTYGEFIDVSQIETGHLQKQGELLLAMDKITDQIRIDNTTIVASTRDQVVELSKIEGLLGAIKKINIDRAEIQSSMNAAIELELQLTKQKSFFNEQAKSDISEMFDLEVLVGKETGKKLEQLKKEAELREKIKKAFFQSQVGKVAGQFTGISSAIQGAEAAGPLGAVAGFLTDALLANEGIKLAIDRINVTIGRLIEPIAEVLAPVFDALNEAIAELIPLIRDLAPAIRFALKPFIASIKALEATIQFAVNVWQTLSSILEILKNNVNTLIAVISPLTAAIKVLADSLDKIPGGGGDAGDVPGTSIPIPVGPVTGLPFSPFHDGGLIRQQDLTRLPGMTHDEGLIRAQAGERVLTQDQQQQQGMSMVFNISAIDPRGTKEEIRQVIEEFQARGKLAF